MMARFRIALTLRYTRISCQPFGARLEFERLVQAESAADAVRQACLCLDAELERIVSTINAINVSEFPVEVREVSLAQGADTGELWNPQPFPPDRRVPPHFLVRDGSRI